ncbi:Hypothetical Protein FCC1311_072212 [Hondaea fermentalgiana]|uniref:Uncharacterized protein n=1 Tax=Hondaea fermentalgiana TaxID=2315210 RepID=A0A2R5GJE2_9STRA|nr:Hypothetical Protein FCC1311_072212 [Hondaea fermentalgiana]|eukprot:GBG31000.1 Hypothetical Protein FCC1311_072212 [Hondaea fermentalgiana]
MSPATRKFMARALHRVERILELILARKVSRYFTLWRCKTLYERAVVAKRVELVYELGRLIRHNIRICRFHGLVPVVDRAMLKKILQKCWILAMASMSPQLLIIMMIQRSIRPGMGRTVSPMTMHTTMLTMDSIILKSKCRCATGSRLINNG